MIQEYNKGKDKNDRFKVIYGTELTLVDDNVSIVLRSNDQLLLDQEYVVFDLETTGFNAAGGDSIIEIGAVKLKNGEIVDKIKDSVIQKKVLELAQLKELEIPDEEIRSEVLDYLYKHKYKVIQQDNKIKIL